MRAVFVAGLFVVACVAGCDDDFVSAKAPAEDASNPSVPLEPAPVDGGPRPESAGWSIAVVQTEVTLTAGASEPIVVEVVRSDFDATEVELSMTGLAPGISVSSTRVAADVDTGTLVLSVADDAAQELSRPTIEARGGIPDPSFDGDGRLVQTLGSNAVASALLVHPLGGLLVGGTENGPGSSTFPLARYTSGGKLDTTFGTKGLGRIALGATPELASVVLSPSLDLIGVGTVMTPVPSVAVMRWKEDGTPDPTFGSSVGGTAESFGALESRGRALVMTGGERMLVFGTTRSNFEQDILVARFWR